MKKIFLLSLFLLSVSVFISCNKSIVFDEKIEFQNENWSYENKEIIFETTLKESQDPYTVVLELELMGTPQVEMFNAAFTITTPKGGKQILPIFFNFVNPKEPFIKGSSPNEKTLRLTVYPKRYFSETGNYSFEVNQFSNKADNYGIRSLRMYIEKVK